jgi:hypothetical protein
MEAYYCCLCLLGCVRRKWLIEEGCMVLWSCLLHIAAQINTSSSISAWCLRFSCVLSLQGYMQAAATQTIISNVHAVDEEYHTIAAEVMPMLS